jgi:hypothetical protein
MIIVKNTAKDLLELQASTKTGIFVIGVIENEGIDYNICKYCFCHQNFTTHTYTK